MVAAIRQLDSPHIEAVEKVLTDNFDADGQINYRDLITKLLAEAD